LTVAGKVEMTDISMAEWKAAKRVEKREQRRAEMKAAMKVDK
jgi:hypothetical protein